MLGVSEDNIEFLRDGGQRCIIGTPKSMLKKFEQDILQDDWHSIRDGLEVKFVTMPASDSDRVLTAAPERAMESQERFILCRSRERSKKEEGITQRFEKKVADGLTRMKARCEKQKRDPMTVEREIGRLPLGFIVEEASHGPPQFFDTGAAWFTSPFFFVEDC